jgi:hypothetical protein
MRRKSEFMALTNSKAAACILSSGKMTGAQLGECLVRALPRIKKWLGDYAKLWIVTVPPSGRPNIKIGMRRGAIKKDHREK